MRKPKTTIRTLFAALAFVLAAGFTAATPSEARAEHPMSGVRFDNGGGHYYYQSSHTYYADRKYPRARSFFQRNGYYRNSVKYERRRDRAMDRAVRNLTQGRFHRARNAFQRALRFEQQRQNSLAALERDRVKTERRWHRHHSYNRHDHGRHERKRRHARRHHRD